MFSGEALDDEQSLNYRYHLENVIKNSTSRVREVVIITSHNDDTHDEHIPLLEMMLQEKKVNYQIIYNDELFVTRHNNVVVNSLNWIYYFITRWLIE